MKNKICLAFISLVLFSTICCAFSSLDPQVKKLQVEVKSLNAKIEKYKVQINRKKIKKAKGEKAIQQLKKSIAAKNKKIRMLASQNVESSQSNAPAQNIPSEPMAQVSNPTVASNNTFVQPVPATVPAPVPQPQIVTVQQPVQSNFIISPKVGLTSSGLGSTFGLGCEVSIPIMPSIDGMAEITFIPGSGYSLIGVGGNGVYNFPVIPGMPGKFYAGGGLVYEMLNIDGLAAVGGSVSGIGLQALGGMNIPIPGAGNVFAQIKYMMLSMTYSYNFGGVPLSASYDAGGFFVEGGYRFYL